jgi:ABC-type amino acid transport substrate-binding protein
VIRIKITLILLLISTGLFSQKAQLKLASDIWPPFTNVETEKSIALDIVNEALQRSGVAVATSILGFNEVLRGIRSGNYTGSAALWRTGERENLLVFSEPYLQNQLVLVGRKGSNVSFDSIAEIKNSRIGLVKDYAYGELLAEVGSVSLIYGDSDQHNLEKLLSGNVDYILVDAILIHYLMMYQVNDVRELLEIAPEPLITKTLHLAVRKDFPGVEDLISRFDEEISKMIADGTYNEILGFNWIRADVDGDGTVELVLEGDQAGTARPSVVYSIYTVAQPAGTDRYYIDGQLYNGWNNIPDRYKKEAMQGAGPDPNKVGFKL